MNRIKRLLDSYSRYISVPWRTDAAPAQRVIFCVYSESDERLLRARIEEFGLVTRQSGHEWFVFDLTDSFPEWMVRQRYAESYFKQPDLLQSLLERFLEDIGKRFDEFLEKTKPTENAVVSLKGVGSLFGLLKVRDLVDLLAPKVEGRLLVFFPGSYENNNYRLLDGYDGWNYLAVPITASN